MPTLAMPTKPRPEAPRIGPRVLWLIQHAPPPTPACYDSDAEWRGYLHSLAESGELPTRRQDRATWTTIDGKKVRVTRSTETVLDRVDHCADCAIGSPAQRAKQQAGRCVLPPLPYRVQPALFDALTDSLLAQRDQVAVEQAKRRQAKKIAAAVAVLHASGFRVVAPEVARLTEAQP